MADVDSSRLKTTIKPAKHWNAPIGTTISEAPRGEFVLAEDYDALLTRIAELELLADDARGKRCPECSAPMVSLSTIDGGQRVCSGCDKVWSWHLKEGQPPLIGNNRMVKKV